MKRAPWIAVLLIAATTGHALGANAEWKVVSTYGKTGDETTVHVNPRSVVRTGRMVRGWVLQNYASPQAGDWVAVGGGGAIYASTMQVVLINCETHDFGYGSKHFYSGPKATGDSVHSISTATPKVAEFPVPPDTVGDHVADYMCGLKR